MAPNHRVYNFSLPPITYLFIAKNFYRNLINIPVFINGKMPRPFTPVAKEYDPLAVGSIDGTDTEPHDNGVVRAINSEYIPDISLPGKPKCTVFVGRLHPKITEHDLEKFFKEFGKVKRCTVIKDLVTGQSKQYGFVEFEKESQADRAYRRGHKGIIRGLEILVDWEFGRTMKGWKPRRLGGGFGGKRESGQLRFGCRARPWKPPIEIEQENSKMEKDIK